MAPIAVQLDQGDTFELGKECIDEGMPTAAGSEIEKVLREFLGDAVTFESATLPDEVDLIAEA